eukprot:10939030-Prorocentrum_lima.AAC.1
MALTSTRSAYAQPSRRPPRDSLANTPLTKIATHSSTSTNPLLPATGSDGVGDGGEYNKRKVEDK